MELTWADLHHDDLTKAQLHTILALRNRVFVVEQKAAYLDIDGLDLAGDTRHVLGESDGDLVAYARILEPDPGDGQVRVGRVIVAEEARGARIGRSVMVRALVACETHWPGAPVRIAAQAHLRDFYGALGFHVIGDEYDEDGIPHLDMLNRA